MPALVDEFQPEAEARHRRRITRRVVPRLAVAPGHVDERKVEHDDRRGLRDVRDLDRRRDGG